MMRNGVTIPLEPFQNRHFADLVRTADRCGYDDLWSFESFATEAFSPLAAAAMLTDRMRLGTAIVPVFTRPPALIAMSAATVQQISGGRFILGVGISTAPIVQQWMGVPYERTNTRLRETVAAIRSAFTLEKVVLKGKTVNIDGFRMNMELETPPKIYIGAQGSKMLRLAGEIGDGLITNFVTPRSLPAMINEVREGRKTAGKDPDAPLDIVCRIFTAVEEDDAAVRAILRRALTMYLTVPQYNRFFRDFGFENEANTAIEKWNKGDRRGALESVPDRMLEEIYVFGSAAHCRKRLEQFAAAGVTTTALEISTLAATPEERRKKILYAIESLAPR